MSIASSALTVPTILFSDDSPGPSVPVPDPRDVAKALIGAKKDARKKRAVTGEPREKDKLKARYLNPDLVARATVEDCCKPIHGALCCMCVTLIVDRQWTSCRSNRLNCMNINDRVTERSPERACPFCWSNRSDTFTIPSLFAVSGCLSCHRTFT